MRPTILMLGSFDTKAREYAYLRERILEQGLDVLAINTGVLGDTRLFPIDVHAADVVRAAGGELAALRASQDRGAAMKTMADGAASTARRLWDEGRIQGIIGMGGSGGSSVVTAAMRALPVGAPKVCVSTVAAGDTSSYVGTKDVTLIPSITDVAGVNRISRIILARAAGAVCGMVRAEPPPGDADRPVIVASMFGNTTQCVDACREQLDRAGYEVLVFHATGAGGRVMESLIDEGWVDGCLDVTTTEWADEICGGVFGAGEDRLSAAGRRGVPHLIVPGCIDMVNFGPIDSVPASYRRQQRLFYEWNPSVTLMRTNVEENRRLGKIFADKANAAAGPVAFVLPRRGVSILDGDGQRFEDRAADDAFFQSLKSHLQPGISVIEVDANINDAAFADRAAGVMLELLQHKQPGTSTPAGQPTA